LLVLKRLKKIENLNYYIPVAYLNTFGSAQYYGGAGNKRVLIGAKDGTGASDNVYTWDESSVLFSYSPVPWQSGANINKK
jgi:hypothetical protein